MPTFNPKIGRFTRQGDGSFALVSSITLTRPNGTTGITGLPNPANTNGLESAKDPVTGAAVTFTPDVGGTGGQDTFGLDSEGLALATDGSFWVSDECGLYIVKFNSSGVEQERLSPIAVNTAGRKLPAVFARRRPNRGMEGLCITPSGKLVGIMQNALRNNATGTAHANGVNNATPTVRVLVYDPVAGTSKQCIYLLTDPSTNVALGLRISEIAAINETKFLVIERDDAFPSTTGTGFKKLYEIDLSAATDVNDSTDAITGRTYRRSTAVATVDTIEKFTESLNTAAATTVLSELRLADDSAAAPIVPVTKVERADLITALGRSYDHDKIEGLAVLATTGTGVAQVATRITITNDDDFGLTNGATNYTIAAKTTSQSLPDFNEIAELDISVLGTVTLTATVNVTVPATTPYLIPSASGVSARALFTVGDSVNTKTDGFSPYRMVGIPDGMGAFDNGDGTFTLLMNHELGTTAGVARAHGSAGAFVSKWTINKTTLAVTKIEDLVPTPTPFP